MSKQYSEAEIFQNRCALAAACKLPDAWKTIGRLAKVEEAKTSYCCLGKACSLLPLKQEIMLDTFDRFLYIIRFDDLAGGLPKQAQSAFGFTETANFTFAAKQICKISFPGLVGLYSPINSLAHLNDSLNDPTLFRIGSFIEHLLVLEYLFNIPCFIRPTNP